MSLNDESNRLFDERIEYLSDKCNEGLLTEDERREYEAYAQFQRYLSLLLAQNKLKQVARSPLMPANAIHWFEIPALDIDRAVKFYNQVLGYTMSHANMHNCTMAMFPCESGVGGAICKQDDFQPSNQGSLVYLDCGPDLSVALAKVEPAGGKIVMPKTAIGEHGFIALFHDTEGNRVGLHSMA